MTGLEIKNAVDEIINEFDPEDFDDAINWGDLACVEVLWVFPLYPEEEHYNPGERYYTEVLIEEAEPLAMALAETVMDEFYDKYGFMIYVRTEW